LRLRNSGAYPIRITGVVGADGNKATQFAGSSTCGSPGGTVNMSNYFYLGPGEEKYFAWSTVFGTTCDWRLYAIAGASSNQFVGAASSLCQNSTTSPGMLDYKSFGFEYIEYLDNNQQITKRQIGKDFLVKCGPSF